MTVEFCCLLFLIWTLHFILNLHGGFGPFKYEMSLIFCLLVGPALFSQSLSWLLILFLRAFLREVSRGGSWCLDLLTDFTVLLKISISDFFYHLTFTFSTFFLFWGLFPNSCIYSFFGMVGNCALGFQHLSSFCNLYFLNCFAICIFTLLQPQIASMPIPALGI